MIPCSTEKPQARMPGAFLSLRQFSLPYRLKLCISQYDCVHAESRHRPAQVSGPAADQMKTMAEAADAISLCASFPRFRWAWGVCGHAASAKVSSTP
jgi:hypothetical protein